MTKEEIKAAVATQLKNCRKELADIELTNDKSRRERWRYLKKFEKYAEGVLSGQ